MTEHLSPSPSLQNTPLEKKTCTHVDGDNVNCNTSHDEGQENLDIMLSVIEEQENLENEVITLSNAFMEDVRVRTKEVDVQFLSGLKKFFTTYLDTVKHAEPATSATPKLASLLHTCFSQQIPLSTQVAGSRYIHVQPTAIAKRRYGNSSLSRCFMSHASVHVMSTRHNIPYFTAEAPTCFDSYIQPRLGGGQLFERAALNHGSAHLSQLAPCCPVAV